MLYQTLADLNIGLPSPGTINEDWFPDGSHLLKAAVSVPDHLRTALETVQKLETLPSCNRMATAALLDSCQSIDASAQTKEDHGPDTFVEATKTVYAARLAICELSDAKVVPPKQCAKFVPTKRTAKKTWRGIFDKSGPTEPMAHYEQYEDVTERDSDVCVSALYTEPQAWTSFSNARQNAVVLCQAVRTDVEKQEQIELFRKLTLVTQDVASATSSTAQEAEEARSGLRELRFNIQRFQMDFHDGQKEQQAEIARRWDDLYERLQDSADSLSSKAQDINTALHEAADALNVHEQRVGAAFNTVDQQFAEIATKQQVQANSLAEHNGQLQASVEYIHALIQESITKVVLNITQSAELTNALMSKNYAVLEEQGLALNGNNNGLVAFGAALMAFESRMQQFGDDQLQQYLKTQDLANKTEESLHRVSEKAAAIESQVDKLNALFPWLADTGACIWWMAKAPLHFFLAATAIFLSCYRFGSLSFMTSGCITAALATVATVYFTSFGGPLDALERWQLDGVTDIERYILMALGSLAAVVAIVAAAPELYRRVNSAVRRKDVGTHEFAYYDPHASSVDNASYTEKPDSPHWKRGQDADGIRRWQV